MDSSFRVVPRDSDVPEKFVGFAEDTTFVLRHLSLLGWYLESGSFRSLDRSEDAEAAGLVPPKAG